MAGSLPPSGVALVAQNAGQFLSAMKGAENALGVFGRGASGMSNIVTGAFRQVGTIITNMAADAARAVGAWFVDSIGVAGDFEQTLNVLGATSGATGAQLEQVAAKAKELGADMQLPATSAQDAAEVMLELSKAGLTVQESMDAAKGALQLSAAAQVDAATAASITAGALNAFGLEASEATRIADLLAAGANASSASMTDLSQGLQQAGFAFNAAGMPVEDLVTSLAALTNVGLTGSDAGTALKNALMRLMDPTDKAAGLMEELGFSAYDATGKMKPLPVLIGDLNRAFAGMTEQERNAALGNIFLSDGMKAMIPLLDLGTDGFLSLKDAVTEEGAAAMVAQAQMQGWNGGVQAVQSQMETLQLVIGTFLKDALTPLLFWLAETISNVTTLADRFFKMLPAVQSSAEPFRTFLNILMILNPSLVGAARGAMMLYDFFAPLVTAFADGNVSAGDLATTLGTLLIPLGATMTSIVTATTAIQQIREAFARVSAIVSGEFNGAVTGAQGVLATVVNFVLSSVLPAIATMATWFASNLPAAIATAKGVFADLGAFIGGLMPTIESIVTTAITIMSTFWQNHGTDIQTIVTGAYTTIQGLITVVLGAIQGTLAIILAAMTGDWQSQMGTIRSSNETIWNGIAQFFDGILNIIAAGFGTSLTEIANTWASNFRKMSQLAQLLMAQSVAYVTEKVLAIKSVIDTVISGAVAIWNSLFGDLGATVSSVMSGAASIVESKVSQISGAFSGIKSAIDGVISKVRSLIDWLSKISVPDIVLPGSPTPFEIGLRGITSAAKQAAATFQTQFNPALSSIPALQLPPMPGGSGNTTNNTSYTMPIYTNQSPAVLSQSLALVEALSA